MTPRRSGPGRRVGTGRLRVDATRAVQKLREYQLPDKTLWVLEAIRGAIAAGATAVDLRGDSNDVWLSWAGPALAEDSLTTVLDELVSPAPSRELRHLRLLATGLNTALGLAPRFVDLISVTEDGAARRVRYRPSLFDARGEGGSGALAARLTVEAVPPPPGVPSPGVQVHVRRAFGMETLSFFLRRREPPELAMARVACADSRVPITVAGVTLQRDTSTRDLLRFELGDGLDGFLALTAPADWAAGSAHLRVDVAELGVLLASHGYDVDGVERGPGLPARIFVDAKVMPTNASRSAVRIEEPPVGAARERGRALLPAAVQALVRELGDDPLHAWSSSARASLYAAAVRLLARSMELGGLAALVSATYPEWLVPLREARLFRDALGRTRSLGELARRGPGVAHHGVEPLGEELEEWIGDALWLPPGDPALGLFPEGGPSDAAELVAEGRHSLEARRRFREHRVRSLAVEPAALQWLVLPLGADVPGTCVPTELFDGVVGHVCLLDPVRRAAFGEELRFLHERRELETVRSASPLPFTAVLEASGVRPTPGYRLARRDDAFERAVLAARGGAARALEVLALLLLGEGADVDGLDLRDRHLRRLDRPSRRAPVLPLLRRACGFAARVVEHHGSRIDPTTARALASRALLASPLARAPIWPVVGGGAVSLRQLVEEESAAVETTGPDGAVSRSATFVGWVPAGALERPPLGRRLLELDVSELEGLTLGLRGTDAVFVCYDPARMMLGDRALELARELVRGGAPAALAIDADGFRGAIGWGGPSSVELRHVGVRLQERERQGCLSPCRVVVDDDEVWPTPTWEGTLRRARTRPIDLWEIELCRAVVRRLCGEAEPRLATRRGALVDDDAAMTGLLAALSGEAPARTILGDDLFERFVEQALFRVAGSGARSSLRELCDAAGGPLPFLPPDVTVGVDLGGWAPVRLGADDAAALGRIVGREVVDGTEELVSRRRAAQRSIARARHLGSTVTPPRVDAGTPSVEVHGSFVDGRVALAETGTTVHVTIANRPFQTLHDPGGLPLLAVLDVPEEMADELFEALTAQAARKVRGRVRVGARALLVQLAKESPETLHDDPRAMRLCARWLSETRTSKRGPNRRARRRLAECRAWPTIQRGRASVEEALFRGRARVARWSGVWLGPDDGERGNPLDAPILALPASDDSATLEGLFASLTGAETVTDSTSAVEQLQITRGIAAGLVSKPTLTSVEPRFVRDVYELTKDKRSLRGSLGVGQVGLVAERESVARIFDHGALVGELRFDVRPALRLAIESPRLAAEIVRHRRLSDPVRASLESAAGKLAELLVESVLADPEPAPVWLRASLREAICAGALGGVPGVAAAPVFETTADRWCSLADIRAEVVERGEVWSTPDLASTDLPLDPSRIVVRLSPEQARGLPVAGVVDAREELRLDRLARSNMARAASPSLRPSGELEADVLATVDLAGKAPEAARGTVSLLRPRAHERRAVWPHRAMHPFDPIEDPCEWPTLALVDSTALVPDRTWSRPAEDDALRAVLQQVSVASRRAVDGLWPAPAGALAQVRVGRWLSSGGGAVTGRFELLLLGRAWIEGEPYGGSLEVLDPAGVTHRAPLFCRGEDGFERVLPLHGRVAVFPEHDAKFVEQVGRLAYGRMAHRLARDLAGAGRVAQRDLATAHVVHAIAIGALRGKTLAALELSLPCFRPAPLDRDGLLELLSLRPAVPLVRAGDAAPGGALALVDDGTALSRVLAHHLRSELVRVRAAPAVPPPPVPRPDAARPVESVARARLDLRAPLPPHPLAPLVDALHERLVSLGVTDAPVPIFIDEPRASPMVRYEGGALRLSGEDERLRSVAAHMLARDPRVEGALTLLTAHLVGALNQALSPVTDGAEAAAIARML